MHDLIRCGIGGFIFALLSVPVVLFTTEWHHARRNRNRKGFRHLFRR